VEKNREAVKKVKRVGSPPAISDEKEEAWRKNQK
jgi:hypothetical protein